MPDLQCVSICKIVPQRKSCPCYGEGRHFASSGNATVVTQYRKPCRVYSTWHGVQLWYPPPTLLFPQSTDSSAVSEANCILMVKTSLLYSAITIHWPDCYEGLAVTVSICQPVDEHLIGCYVWPKQAANTAVNVAVRFLYCCCGCVAVTGNTDLAVCQIFLNKPHLGRKWWLLLTWCCVLRNLDLTSWT